MKIANETLTWQPGACTLLDDSFEHSVTSRTGDKRRVILELKITHPDFETSSQIFDYLQYKDVSGSSPPKVVKIQRQAGEQESDANQQSTDAAAPMDEAAAEAKTDSEDQADKQGEEVAEPEAVLEAGHESLEEADKEADEEGEEVAEEADQEGVEEDSKVDAPDQHTAEQKEIEQKKAEEEGEAEQWFKQATDWGDDDEEGEIEDDEKYGNQEAEDDEAEDGEAEDKVSNAENEGSDSGATSNSYSPYEKSRSQNLMAAAAAQAEKRAASQFAKLQSYATKLSKTFADSTLAGVCDNDDSDCVSDNEL